MCERLWGDHFFDAKNKRWLREDTNPQGEKLKRSFCQFVLGPLYQLYNAVYTDQDAKVDLMLEKLRIVLTHEERELPCRKKMKTILNKWLPLKDCILGEMVIPHLPSPSHAQQHSGAHILAEMPQNSCSQYHEGVTTCNSKAPLVVLLSSMTTAMSSGSSKKFAFGRVLSGTFLCGQRVRRCGQLKEREQEEGGEGKEPVLVVQQCLGMMGRYGESLPDIPAGNLCYVTLDQEVTFPSSATSLVLMDAAALK